MKNHYQTLGVDRNANPDEIKRAYRKLASQHHPDKGGDKLRFQEIEEAYRTLSDPQQRQQYDNPQVNVNFGPMGGGFDFENIFEMFGARFGQAHGPATVAKMTLWISLRDVAQGGRRVIAIGTRSGQSNVEIDIPSGIEDGQSVRYPKIAPGEVDLIIQFRVKPDPAWQRQDFNLITDINIGIWDLILGGETEVTTILDDKLLLNIPENTQPGSMMRLRGHGIPFRGGRGDMIVRIHARLPTTISPELKEHIDQERRS